MEFRIATAADIPGMSRVRFAVQENQLSDPSLVTPENYREMIGEKGAGWVCAVAGEVVGFSIVDLTEANVWALFVDPTYAGRGIGRKLHDEMLAWSLAQGQQHLWLSTDSGTRAEAFYRKAGWQQTGTAPNGEVRFELSLPAWSSRFQAAE
ncbi:GNAT family N-acetyltransferase [Pontibacter akesuensis]|uniref:Ribosomal protein S18 acetylase RimI n=1 Tax=Pontibacter akesuensis TaxID=388950 RepID=A0A1I7JGT6_9BACT|nr:GNAT family N-acetyltransferase [Pontibacter akesuensis]GHA70094.1 hypothetical protein GCM10007389_24140 [Pontibacter akesuensis]SFU84368.1 Ribosomal protein S18 acetylase RimI [Pontibacter akesuensis]